MQARVEDNPRHQESGKRRHKAFLHQLPNTAISILVHVLEVNGIQVDNAAADTGEAKKDNRVNNGGFYL